MGFQRPSNIKGLEAVISNKIKENYQDHYFHLHQNPPTHVDQRVILLISKYTIKERVFPSTLSKGVPKGILRIHLFIKILEGRQEEDVHMNKIHLFFIFPIKTSITEFKGEGFHIKPNILKFKLLSRRQDLSYFHHLQYDHFYCTQKRAFISIQSRSRFPITLRASLQSPPVCLLQISFILLSLKISSVLYKGESFPIKPTKEMLLYYQDLPCYVTLHL